jgi:hypothetical protein
VSAQWNRFGSAEGLQFRSTHHVGPGLPKRD